jgi:hypothetical protein
VHTSIQFLRDEPGMSVYVFKCLLQGLCGSGLTSSPEAESRSPE